MLPHVFTEQGVAMLSSVLNSKRAVQVNIVDYASICQVSRNADTPQRRGRPETR
jgi:hypothetical protein